jgi:integron integrase
VVAFLSDLAMRGEVSASTQNQALSALLFLYRVILRRELQGLGAAARASAPRRLPVVLTRDEVRAVLGQLTGTHRMMATLLYGSGLRLMECLRLRVHDIDFSRHQITIREGKGRQDRPAILPRTIEEPLRQHLARVKSVHQRDLEGGGGRAKLPYALERKHPSASKHWEWQWVFPASRISRNPRSGELRRHHLHESALQRAVKGAGVAAGIEKGVTNAPCGPLRCSWRSRPERPRYRRSCFQYGFHDRAFPRAARLGRNARDPAIRQSHPLTLGREPCMFRPSTRPHLDRPNPAATGKKSPSDPPSPSRA